jgi:large subunit ribosomal protein L25
MAESLILVAKKREDSGSQVAKRLRKEGLVPGILYGHKEETIAITLSRDDLQKTIRHGAHLIDLETDGKVEKVRIRELQWDHLGHDMFHVDFQRT